MLPSSGYSTNAKGFIILFALWLCLGTFVSWTVMPDGFVFLLCPSISLLFGLVVIFVGTRVDMHSAHSAVCDWCNAKRSDSGDPCPNCGLPPQDPEAATIAQEEAIVDVVEALASNSVPCPSCRYDLRGIREPRCPECGRPISIDDLVGPLTLGEDAPFPLIGVGTSLPRKNTSRLAVATVVLASACVLLPLALGVYSSFAPSSWVEEFEIAIVIGVIVLIAMYALIRVWMSNRRRQ